VNEALGLLIVFGMFKKDTGSIMLAKKKALKAIPMMVNISLQE